MLRIFINVMKRVLKIGGDRVAVAFEWPRGASGWQLVEMEELKNYLPHECRFDGCQHGLTTMQGIVKKPWRVQTNVKELVEPLSRCCNMEHQHVTLRTRGGEVGSLYTGAREHGGEDDHEHEQHRGYGMRRRRTRADGGREEQAPRGERAEVGNSSRRRSEGGAA